MSAGFGHNKGKDGKYNTLNLTSYKGRSVDSAKHSGATVRHGLQSLGKVAATRRVPPPANLPSLKSENLGNDPNVNLVPKDGSGWASKSETPTQQQSQPATQTQQVLPQRQASATYAQTSAVNQALNPVAFSNQNISSQSNGSGQPTWGHSRFSQAGNKISGATGGAPAPGTTPFSEDFPTLGSEAKEQQNIHGVKSKEQQYGPGPSLRPQNVASWRVGGGQNLNPKESYSSTESSKVTETSTQGGSSSPFDIQGTDNVHDRPAIHQGVAQNVLPQNYPGQYRPGMMPQRPQYMYEHRFPHGMHPPGPNMRYPTAMMPNMRYPPFPNDPRFRTMMNQSLSNAAQQEPGAIPPMISPSDLKDFDKLDKDEDVGWAGMHGEVDYTEKLVFSEDEDNGKSSHEKDKSISGADYDGKMDRRHRESSGHLQQAWGSYEQQAAMYYMYRSAHGQQPLKYRNKSQAPYDKRIPPPNQVYAGGQMAPHHPYGSHPGAMGSTRFSSPMVEQSLDRSSPRGDEDQWKKKEKEEAVERARKRREEEEKRMEKQRRSSNDDSGYYMADPKRNMPYPRRYATPEEDAHAVWQHDYPPGHDERGYYNRRTESESSDDRKMNRDRLPGDGYGGYRHQPRPSAGGMSGRNLPPRLANQRQKQVETRNPSSIMKRERVESEGSETLDGRNRKQFDSHSIINTGGETPVEEKRSHVGRDIFRKDERKLDDRRNVENISPSTTSSDREPRLWDAGSSKRSSIKRQSSRDSPVSVGSSGDARLNSQKTLLTRNDSRGKSITKCGSNQSNQSLDREDTKQPATVMPRRGGNEKLKLIDFRVEGSDDNDKLFRKPASVTHKIGKNSGSKSLGQRDESLPDTQSSWKNDNRPSKPIATVSPTATTTTSVSRDSRASFNITRITREVPPDPEGDRHRYEVPVNSRLEERPSTDYTEGTSVKSAWRTEVQEVAAPRDEWDQDDEGAPALPTIKESQRNKEFRGNRNKPKSDGSRPEGRYNRNSHDTSDRSYRHAAKEYRNSDRVSGDYRGDAQEGRDEGRAGGRRYKTGDNRHRAIAQDRGVRNDGDRYPRNRKEPREVRRDSKPNQAENSGSNSQTSQSQRASSSKAQTLKQTNDKPLFSSKPTAAAAPLTNIWEERKKQKEAEKNTYIPTEEDKKRTLKETAPNPRLIDDSTKLSKDDKNTPSTKKSSRDSNNRNQTNETRTRQNYSGSDKRFMSDKPNRTSSGRRGGSTARQSGRPERKSSSNFPPSEFIDRDQRSSRGRGRSRGSLLRGSGRGRGQPGLERSSNRNAGRGRATSNYNLKPGISRGKSDSRKYNENDEYDSQNDDHHESNESDFESINIPRRRRVGEGSDAEDDYSTEGSFSDSEAYNQKQTRVRESTFENRTRNSKFSGSHYKPASSLGRGRSDAHAAAGFQASGAPTRRGRGRGALSAGVSRGRGRGSSRNSAPPPFKSYNSDERGESRNRQRNSDRDLQEGPDKRGLNDRRRKRKVDKPPRFAKNAGRSQPPHRRDAKPLSGDRNTVRDGISPTGDGGAVHSSDVGNEEWETASDNSNDAKKTPIHPRNNDLKKSEPKRSFSNQRPPVSGRSRGGKNPPSSDRLHQVKKNMGKMDSQVYTIHTVNYSNPSAIEGAIRNATTSEEAKIKKQEEAQKIKHEDLFRMYDLNNYAGVVNVDDLPDLPAAQRKLQPTPNVQKDVVVKTQDSAENPKVLKSEKSDDFTTVLSKKAFKKRQEESRKKDEDQMNEAVRKAKLEQQRQNRQKFFNKNSTTAIASGSSGSMKQSVPTSINESNLWSTLDSWTLSKDVKEKDAPEEASVSQHDSGVESSVPSSQRSSPGTEAKLTFSHFGATFTSTSVITSIGNDQISSSVVSSASISNLMSQKNVEDQTYSFIEAPKTGTKFDLNETVSSLSPSRSSGTRMGPIGNERLKTAKPTSIENIATLFPSMDDKNSISFIADDAKDNSALSTSEIHSETFSSPFGDNLDALSELKPAQKFSGFPKDDFSSDQASADMTLASFSVSNFQMSLSSAASVVSTLPSTSRSSDRHAPTHTGYIHSAKSNVQFNEVLPSIHISNQTVSSVANAGVKSDSEKPTGMTLSPQTANNDGSDLTGRSLEGSSVPGPIPLPPPKHSVANAQRPDGDSQSESRQLREVNANANGAGDMGVMTPTSPSVDLNLKMESARKAWENISETSMPSSQQSHSETPETYSYHQSAAGGTEHLQTESSNLPSASLSVTNSSEWKPRQSSGTATASADSEESWRSNISQQNQNPNITSVTQTPAFNKPVATSTDDTPSMSSAGFSVETPGSVSMAQTHHLKQTVSQTYSSSGGMIYNRPSPYDQAPRLPPPQASPSALLQTISSSSLASNLHNMQQAYPLDYSASLYPAGTSTGYSNLQHPSYNAQRDYNQQVIFATSTVATSAVKQASQTTIALKPVQPTQALRDGSIATPAYIGTSALQGLEQQASLGSAQLGIPRPHGGASPAQPSITYIVDQTRIASQALPGVNSITPPQIPHSTSYYSQLYPSGSSYSAQPQPTQMRQQQTYQQTLVGPQPANFQQGLNIDSSIWTLGSMQQSPYPPIAPPAQQRIRNDTDYYSYYQQKSAYGPAANKFVPSSQATGSFGAVKSHVPVSGYDMMKNTQMFSPKASTPGNQDHQLSKYSATSPNKPFSSQSVPAADWNKSISTQQYKANSVQGLLSRPYSSGADAPFQQSSPTVTMPSYFPHKPDMNMSVRLNFPHQPPAPQPYSQQSWGQAKPPTPQGIMGIQPPSVMSKVPRSAMTPTPMVGQRQAMPQNFQQAAHPSSQVPVAPRQSISFSAKSRQSGSMRTSTPTTQQFSVSSENTSNKSKTSQSNQTQKVPPLPTLVRGSGSNLAGKKPTFMPEDVVKTNQANERASLLQSLSAFFPDKDKSSDSAETSQDWSTQVANSSPLPKRKPGLRHPGIERRRPGKDSKSGPIGNNSKQLKRLQSKSKKEEIPPESPDPIVRTVKKMTLADTEPKRGEVAKIQLS